MTERIKLPPLPTGIFAHSEEDEKLKYLDDATDINARMRHKLYTIWIYLSYLTSDKDIAGLINAPTKKKTSPEFKLKSYLLNVFDQLGKILAVTDLPEELFGVPASQIQTELQPDHTASEQTARTTD